MAPRGPPDLRCPRGRNRNRKRISMTISRLWNNCRRLEAREEATEERWEGGRSGGLIYGSERAR